jgi:hypothetical protein
VTIKGMKLGLGKERRKFSSYLVNKRFFKYLTSKITNEKLKKNNSLATKKKTLGRLHMIPGPEVA